jgi:hypothetical protein
MIPRGKCFRDYPPHQPRAGFIEVHVVKKILATLWDARGQVDAE